MNRVEATAMNPYFKDQIDPSSSRSLEAGTHRYYATERVNYGVSFEKALMKEIEESGAQRVFVVVAPQVVGSEAFVKLTKALGSRHCGTFSEIPAHVPYASVAKGVEAARNSKTDLMVTLGGGSAIDMTKAIALSLRFDLRDLAGLESYSDLSTFDPSRRFADDVKWVRSIAIPTTLSAAEFTWFAGVTDTNLGIKRVLGHPMLVPRTVIYDPILTVDVPLPLFLASGIKAVDHAAESIASLRHQPFSDAVSKEALQMLADSLPRVAKNPKDMDARLHCQVAAWLSISGGASGVGVGASHAIGHMLGAHTSMAHGFTSCAVLASVMRWNRPVNEHRQSIISAALNRRGLDAGEAIEDLVKVLELPYRLRDFDVSPDVFPVIARKTMEDASILKNPREVKNAEDVLEILHMAL